MDGWIWEDPQTTVTEIFDRSSSSSSSTINIAAPNTTSVQPEEPSEYLAGKPDQAAGSDGIHGGGALNSYSSWQFGASSSTGPLFGEPNNDKGKASKGGIRQIYENPKQKEQNPRSDKRTSSAKANNIDFRRPLNSSLSCPNNEGKQEPAGSLEAMVKMKEMMYYTAAFRPVNFGLERVEKKKRRTNVKFSKDPQTVAARRRRERISEKIRVLQSLVPGGTKMDIASMLDEAANYIKFLRSQIKSLESLRHELERKCVSTSIMSFSFNSSFPLNTYFPL